MRVRNSKRGCVRPSVGPSARGFVRNAFFFLDEPNMSENDLEG